MRIATTTLAVVALLLACGDAATAPDAATTPDPTRVPIADCAFGHFFADCGCDGAPVFACTPTADCAWFLDGCVSDRHHASSCPPGDLCCVDGWPYDRDTSPTDGLHLTIALHAFGTNPWDLDRDMNLTVAVDPSLEPGDVTVTCTDPPAPIAGSPCDETATVSAAYEPQDLTWSLLLGVQQDLFGWDLLIEVPQGPTPEVARACRLPYTDALSEQCTSGTGPADPICADAGTLTLIAVPTPGERPHGQLDLTFPDGRALTATF